MRESLVRRPRHCRRPGRSRAISAFRPCGGVGPEGFPVIDNYPSRGPARVIQEFKDICHQWSSGQRSDPNALWKRPPRAADRGVRRGRAVGREAGGPGPTANVSEAIRLTPASDPLTIISIRRAEGEKDGDGAVNWDCGLRPSRRPAALVRHRVLGE
jgi:hypothetical protein